MADTNGGMGMFGQDASGVFFEDDLAADLAWAEFFGEPSGSTTHDATGALTGQGSAIAATSARFRQFSSTGTLIGPVAALVGASARSSGPVTHATSGALTGPGAQIVSTSVRFRTFGSSGALVGPLSSVAGTAARFRSHATTGALIAAGAVIAGAAARTPAPIAHAASGAMQGAGAIITGSADRGALPAATGSELDLLRRRRRRVH